MPKKANNPKGNNMPQGNNIPPKKVVKKKISKDVDEKNQKTKIKMKNIKKVADTYKSKDRQRLITSALFKGEKVKSTKHYVAYNPETKTVISGNLSKVAKDLKSSGPTLKKRFSDNSFKNVKGFQIFRFDDDVASVNFRKNIVKKDVDKPKKNTKPIPKKPSYTIIPNNNKKKLKSKFGAERQSYTIKFNNGLEVNDLDEMIASMLDDTIKRQKLDADDYIRIVILDDNLDISMGGTVSTPLMKIKDFTPQKLWDLLEKISTSDASWEITEASTFIIETIRNYTGKGNKDGYTGDKDNYASFKRSILTIKNDDDMCMARAIVVGISLIRDKPKAIPPNKSIGRESNEFYKKWELMRKAGPTQTFAAEELHTNAGVSTIGGCGLVEAHKFQQYLSTTYGYQLNIFDLMGKRIIYPNIDDTDYHPVEQEDNIYLLYNNEIKHYDLINNNKIAGFLEKSNFCHSCKTFYRRENQHSCKFKCSICCEKICDSIKYFNDCKINKIKPEYPIECIECCRYFSTQCCYNNHKKITYKKNGQEIKPVCDRVWKCPKCKIIIIDDADDRKKTHICGQFRCSNCKQDVMPGHQCYMMPIALKEHSDKYVFFDFESDISGEEGHIVMFSVSAYFDDPIDKYIIHHNIEEFCEWVFDERHKDYTFIAHYGKGYDFQFILKWVIENIMDINPPSLIKAGSKIMCMTIPKHNIRFIDSMNFVASPLASFPDIFGIKEIAKGYFPHWFNTADNWTYDGVMPPYDMFRPWNMKDDKKIHFDKWYCFQKFKNYRWKQINEMKKYCISDVNILQLGMLKFRELFIKVAKIDPLRYITIAGVCMNIYRHYYIDPSFPQRLEDFTHIYDQEMSGEIRKELKEVFQSETNEIVFRDKKFGCFDFDLIEKIRPSFFGGRTNATKLIYHFKKGEEGMYDDIRSLYPTVQFYDEYPTGHPEIIDKKYIDKYYKKILVSIKKKRYFGFINCKICPPKNLYHPVLCHKGEKLVFDLRTKEGTWATNEIYKAISMGYEIDSIKEIIHFPETSNKLFRDYVSKFLKLKEESSGYPEHILKYEGKVSAEVYEKMKDKHIEDFYNAMGIKLDKDNIEYNEGMRAIAKLCLNSLWGKFGQRINLGECIIVNTPEQLFKVLDNPRNVDINMFQLNDDCLELSYQIKDEFIKNDYTTNIAVASFTTSSARLRLYQGLEHLNTQVLYFDTDSIIYKYNPNDNNCNKKLTRGDNLGDWTDECDGFKMCGTFASGGPKNYTYKLDGKKIKGIRWDKKENKFIKFKENNYDDYDYKIKVKGLNLHYSAKLAVNHHSVIKTIKDKYIKYEDTLIPINYDMIKRDKFCNLINDMMVKNYGVVYTKRKILPISTDGTIDTVPFGYEF